MLQVMAGLPRVAAPGTRWNYSTGETQVVAALVAAATGQTLADYLSAKIWANFGMEADANWWLESPNGIEVGGSGLSATLRDYARFGLFLLHDGVAGGEKVLELEVNLLQFPVEVADAQPVDKPFQPLLRRHRSQLCNGSLLDGEAAERRDRAQIRPRECARENVPRGGRCGAGLPCA